jgi:hypothetical protein
MAESIADYITLMNNVYSSSLTANSTTCQTPPEIKVPLRDHQKALLQAMVTREEEMMRGIELDDTSFYSRIGILGDQVGSGKTLVALAHIALTSAQDSISYKRCISDGPQREHTFSVQNITTDNNFGATLIIVPHILYRQWKTAIEKQTKLNCFFCSSKRDLGRETIVADILASDCVLVSNTLYRYFDELCRDADIQWKRIYVDEVDSMVMPSSRSPLKAAFIWFLTASWQNIISPYNYYYSNVIMNENLQLEPEYHNYLQANMGNTRRSFFMSYRFFENYLSDNPQRYYQVLRTKKEFLEQSLQLPAFNRETIVCEAPAEEAIVRRFITPQIREMLNAGNTEGALRGLGVKEETQTSLVDAVLANIRKDIRRTEQTLEFKQQLEYASPQQKEQAIANLTGRLSSLRTQEQSIKERISNTEQTDCEICYEPLKATTPVLLPCCNNVICGRCVLQHISSKGQTNAANCVWCRTPIDTTKLTAINNKQQPTCQKQKTVQQKPSKLDAVLKGIKEKPNGKFLLFCRYQDIFTKIKAKLEESGITTEILSGNKDMIAAAIDRFRSGESKVLCLQSDIQCAGLNLEAATDIFILHKMDNSTEQQIIGRAQRLGRQTSLLVSSFLYPDELPLQQ